MRTIFDIVVIGDINMDLILNSKEKPVYGQVETLVDSMSTSPGGSAANFAFGAARLGLKVAFISKVGEDIWGRYLIGSLENAGIDYRGVVIDPNLQTGLTLVLASGLDRSIMAYQGSISFLSFQDIDFQILLRARHLHLGCFFMLDSLRCDVPHLFREVKKSGLSISIDTNYDPSGVWDNHLLESLQYADIFLPNETELQQVSKVPDTFTGLERMSKIVPIVAVKQGERGAALRIKDKFYQSDALQVPVVDTTGCGDSFDAGFIYGYLAGWSLERVLKFATICGSMTAKGVGASAPQPTLTEAMSFMAG